MECASNVRVLLVDDEDRFRTTASITLKKRGCQVTSVASGLQALEEIKRGELDVVILDLKMPEMDGLETMKEIRKLRSDVEIIMLTGHGTLQSQLAGLQGKVFAHLSKPCDMDFLADLIHSAFFKKKEDEFAAANRLPERL